MLLTLRIVSGGAKMGVAWVLISALFFSLGSFFGKVVTSTTDMSGVISSFSRFFIGAVMMFIYIIATKRSFKPNDFKPILTRGVFNGFEVILMTGALNYTTMTNANMLNMIYPVLVILFAPILLKEMIKKSTYVYLAAIMLGSYIIVNPSFGNINRGDLMGILSALAASISAISLKEANNKNEWHIIVFYVMLIGTIINIPFSLEYIINFDDSALIYVILSGFMGFSAQIFLTAGYKHVDSATGALVSTSRIVISAILGIVLLSEPLDLRIVIGMILIGGSLVGVSEFFSKKRKLATPDGKEEEE